MSNQSMTLGTLFTANITDFLQKTRLVRAELNRFATVSNQLASGLKNLNTTIGSNIAQQKAALASTQKITQSKQVLGKQISNVEGAWNRLGAAMRVTASYGIAATAIFAVVNALKGGADAIIEFDQALKNIQAITGATNADISIMSDKILQVAERTRYSATEVAEGMILLGQAGFNATESINAIQAASDLAAGTLSSFKDTTDLLTTTIRAFNMDSIESSRVADVMANAINKSKLTIDKLRIAFNYVGATASQAGVKLEETAATMMVLANNGLRASTIGTGMRQVLSKLMAPSRKIKDAFEEYGITLDQINPSIVGFETSIKNLSRILINEKGVVNMTKAFQLFQLRGAQAAAIVTKAFASGDFQSALEKVYEVGSAEAMMTKQAEGLEFQFKNMVDRARNLAIALGDAGVVGIMKVFVSTMSEAINVLTVFTKSTVGGAILRFTLWTAAIYGTGAALSALFTLIKGPGMGMILWVSNLITVFTSLNKTVGLSTALMGTFGTILKANPWLFVASAIAAVVMGLRKLSNRAREAREEQQKLVALTEQSSSSLELYYKAIEKTKGVGVEYESLIQRLVKEHPELTKVVGKNADSYKDLVVELKKLAQIESERNLVARIEEIKLLDKELNKLKRTYDTMSTDYGTYLLSGNKAVVKTMETFLKNSQSGKKTFDELSDSVVVFARRLYEVFGYEGKGDAIGKAEMLMKDSGFDPDVIKKVLSEIDQSFDTFEKRRKDRIEGLKSEYQASEEASNAELSQKKKYYTLLSRMEENRTREVKQEYEARGAEIDKWYKDELERLEKLPGSSTDVADSEYNNLQLQNKKKLSADLAAIDLESTKLRIQLKKEETEKLIEQQKQAAIGDIARLEELKLKEKEITIRNLRDVEALYQKYYEKVAGIYGAESDEAIKAKQEWVRATTEAEKVVTAETAIEAKKRLKDQKDNLKAQLEAVKEFSDQWHVVLDELYKMGAISEKEYTKKLIESFEDLFNKIEEGYKQGKISSETYLAWLEQAYQKDIITHDKYIAKKIGAENNMFNAYKEGFKKANEEVKTFSETMYDIGLNVSKTVSTNLTSSLFDFIGGAKSAKDAFVDFAMSTIKWLGEMIVKQTILNSLQGFSIGGGSKTTPTAPATTPSTIPWSGVAHSGGVIGKKSFQRRRIDASAFAFAPRLHSGLRSDEFPAILQRGEEVRSRRDVANDKRGSDVQVFINEAPPGAKVSQQQSTPDIKKIVIDFAKNDVASGGSLDKTLQSVYGLRRVTAKR